MDLKADSTASSPWYADFPEPKSTAGSITRETLLQMLQGDGQDARRDFLAVDLRRNDHEVCALQCFTNEASRSRTPSYLSVLAY